MALQHLLHEQKVPVRIFLFAKDPGNQLARSIVNGRALQARRNGSHQSRPASLLAHSGFVGDDAVAGVVWTQAQVCLLQNSMHARS